MVINRIIDINHNAIFNSIIKYFKYKVDIKIYIIIVSIK